MVTQVTNFTHIVEPGESSWAITEEYLGDGDIFFREAQDIFTFLDVWSPENWNWRLNRIAWDYSLDQAALPFADLETLPEGYQYSLIHPGTIAVGIYTNYGKDITGKDVASYYLDFAKDPMLLSTFTYADARSYRGDSWSYSRQDYYFTGRYEGEGYVATVRFRENDGDRWPPEVLVYQDEENKGDAFFDDIIDGKDPDGRDVFQRDSFDFVDPQFADVEPSREVSEQILGRMSLGKDVDLWRSRGAILFLSPNDMDGIIQQGASKP